ncbi:MULTISPECIES: O-methyltransferase [unclassified Imperialibacter]|uniref:O-methyltransferase n=1 Tax=unclassified Imperialibacter TaxID=2629706 RepID=UPI00125468B2|nr:MULTISPECIES: class I SAM-dependent methyltransferase [unclassified Imperialibacter]CAD5271228.1 SAM-dependent methyltransferase [Imperialibacter sp. 75]CAD5298486.1 SAM-dependent methyltransferase [Imperialibacter sp. 89]VVT35634.1 Predicted O-methyltransferase YrrM [Imperialibacter sp. EC-SDR9]
MTDEIKQAVPAAYRGIAVATEKAGFTMASDPLTGSLLRTLAASKPQGSFLELGTGTGLSTSWILSGMDQKSSLISVDNNETFLGIAADFLDHDPRLQLVCADGEEWLLASSSLRFDYIFADTWHGKYLMLEDVLAMLKPGGLYIIDDMLPQPNWPEGHHEKALRLVEELEKNESLLLTKQTWSTGIVVATRKAG